MKRSLITGFLLAGLVSAFYLSTIANAQTLSTTNLPIVLIDTHGQLINDEPGIICDLKIINNISGVNTPADTANGFDGKAKVEYHGCSSQNFPKKSLGIELRSTTAVTTSINASLLGFPAESDWLLIASYTDKTFLRDQLAFFMSNQAGRYASRTKAVEVIINNEYQGIYIFEEKVKRDANRVNINKLDPTDLGNNSITGGYIVKIDKTCGSFDPDHQWQSAYSSPGGNRPHYWLTHYPNDDNLVSQQFTYIKNYINTFETTMASSTCCQATTGYSKYVVDDTFIDHFLLEETTSNADAYRFSAYISKERDSKGGKLSAGPIWDLNLAFGFLLTPFPSYSQSSEGWRYLAPGDPAFPVPFWWGKLLSCCTYTHKVVSRYRQLRQTVWQTSTLLDFIDTQYTLMNQGAYDRNFQKWPIIGVSIWNDEPSYNGATLADEIDFLKTWLTNRLNWMDSHIDAFIQEPLAVVSPSSLSIDVGQTAPLSLSFTGNGPWSYTLSSGQSGIVASSPATVYVSPSQTTTYTIQSVSNSCGTGIQSGTAVVTVRPVYADLSIGLSASKRVVSVGDTVSLFLNLYNEGPQTARAIVIENRLPDGLSFSGSSSTALNENNNVVSIATDSLAVGQTLVFTYQLQVNTMGIFWNAAQITASLSTDPDSQPGSGTGDGQDDMAIVDLRVGTVNAPVYSSPNPNQVPLPPVLSSQPPVATDSVELSLAVLTDKLLYKVNDIASITLVVSNRGGLAANNTVIQTLLPDGWQLTSTNGLTVTGQTITAIIESVPAGDSAIVVLAIQMSTTGILTAQILSVDENNVGSIPGNGYTNGEKDECFIQLRVY
ncbi:CotH kinase family protein [Spirosoma sp. SC4-14]|uniref:CotH kinase family protein n=1 Tax=Spirosoma sp. SC4-14 TaxID=3128900 RepID=UPI0030D32586